MAGAAAKSRAKVAAIIVLFIALPSIDNCNLLNDFKRLNKNSRVLSYSGNPAVSLRPVAFRPILPGGLAFAVTYNDVKIVCIRFKIVKALI
jgi:hypothetical protein